MERKLATIRKIDNLAPIIGKDLIELATLDGWQAIVQKGEYNINDLVVYCEIDSFLPVKEEYEFLRSRCFKSTKNLGDGFRIKSMKMGNTISQGLILPLGSIIDASGNPLRVWSIGDDVSELLGIQKYEKPIPANLAGKVRGNFPSFIPKTDQIRVQNCFNDIKDNWIDYTWERTLKLDGSSMTMYCKYEDESWDEGVCSRNLDLKIEDNDGNVFVELRKKLNDRIFNYCVDRRQSLAFQGEAMGSGIQGNRESLKEHTFFCYDIFDIVKQEYLTASERQTICKELEINHCPDLGNIKFDDDITIKDLLNASDIPSLNNPIAEGIVYKSIENPSISFKCINNKFLIQSEE